MITAKFLRKHNKLVYYEISGHAGYSDFGLDIVCSAVSSISYTIANGITDVLFIKPDIEVIDKDGFMSLDLRFNSKEDIEKSQVLMETMLMGIKNIKKSYDDYIKVIEEEV